MKLGYVTQKSVKLSSWKIKIFKSPLGTNVTSFKLIWSFLDWNFLMNLVNSFNLTRWEICPQSLVHKMSLSYFQKVKYHWIGWILTNLPKISIWKILIFFPFQDNSDVDIRRLFVLDTGVPIHGTQSAGWLHSAAVTRHLERLPNSHDHHQSGSGHVFLNEFWIVLFHKQAIPRQCKQSDLV